MVACPKFALVAGFHALTQNLLLVTLSLKLGVVDPGVPDTYFACPPSNVKVIVPEALV